MTLIVLSLSLSFFFFFFLVLCMCVCWRSIRKFFLERLLKAQNTCLPSGLLSKRIHGFSVRRAFSFSRFPGDLPGAGTAQLRNIQEGSEDLRAPGQ